MMRLHWATAPGLLLGGVMAMQMAVAAPTAQPLPMVPQLSAAAAQQIAQAAMASCHDHGFHVSVAIVDPGGTLRTLVTDDGVKPLDITSARLKAVSAMALQARTADVAPLVAANPAYAHMLDQLQPGLLIAAGGVPIMVAGTAIGAIGVGGAPGGDKDQACADAGLANSGPLSLQNGR
jgi:uncharacterized protein GlcG (DUF336 family)